MAAAITRLVISPARFSGLLQSEAHIVAHGEMRIERIGLENHGDAAFGRRHIVDLGAVDENIARRRIFQSGDDTEQGRLSASRRADEDNELAVFHVKIDAFQHIDLAE